MIIDPKYVDSAHNLANKIIAVRDRYETVAKAVCPSDPIPWYFIGLIHHMEADQMFNKHLHNGDPLTARTTHVPANRPINGKPPFTWEESATDALKGQGFGSSKVWDIDDVLTRLEYYNGTGYRRYNINTPYVWSKTNHYTKGRFISDGTFKPDVVSQQIGCAPILSFLLNYDQK